MNTDHAANINDEQGQFEQRHRCKLAAAKEFLGNRWVLHSAYRPQDNLHHTPQHRTASCLARVAEKARWAGRI